ncbi:DUF692 family protein [Alteromonas sp. 5E99-2]|uniref:multinuclear nonheme iron-dependent oxidase n=1 Tax=Alteromonas sp. 5E99-2 TaxID=2817683 RepID=UPI001A9831A3|nr:DUF692 family multinuclear iron-containing protein [Alteromonas sp. 5E99-2]MBO1255728.1 DUF692 family protein [Alteromonas sp. 5E99-2]
MVGVGLRHEHYFDAINNVAPIDFVEVHAENFLSDGGAPRHLLSQARQYYDLSIHATSLGLGSVSPPEPEIVSRIADLCDTMKPFLFSDHACFNRAEVHGKQLHTGDLLPLRFNQASLDILCRHVDLVQNTLGRTLLLENLSSYIPNQNQHFDEFEFLAKLSQKTGCKLLLDLNNLLVNEHNTQVMNGRSVEVTNTVLEKIMNDLRYLSTDMIGEYHLAGTTSVGSTELMIDDHARPVSEPCWSLYSQVLNEFGINPTLIEWDQNLPPWADLTALAMKAKAIQQDIT